MAGATDCEAIVDSSLGQELEKDECQVLTTVMKVKDLKDGEVLVKEGEADNTLFVLTAGKIGVYNTADDKESLVYTMKVGEVAGTRAFVDLAPRRATLKAIGDSTVYTMLPEDFESLLDTNPKIVYKVMRGLFRITHMNLMRMNSESQVLSSYIQKSGGRF